FSPSRADDTAEVGSDARTEVKTANSTEATASVEKQSQNGKTDTEISVRGLTKSFGPQTVLEDITCDIPKGRITLMLGPSGTGKSVFLKCLMGLLKLDRGEIWVGEKNLPTLARKE